MDRTTSLPIVETTTKTIGGLIEDLRINPQATTIIIACCTRSHFFGQLALHALSTSEHLDDQRHEQQNTNEAVSERNEKARQNPSKHNPTSLLQPTLRLLATSLRINLVFCPDIPSFRAYVSALPFREVQQRDTLSTIVIVDMLTMHHGTSEFTIQGLSRTFATLASVNHRLAGGMQIVECNDVLDPTDVHRGVRLWNAEVPLLSGSVKIGEAGQGWAGRTTNIRTFAERWFQFQ